MKIGSDLSSYIEIKRAVRQGCVQSSGLFLLYSEVAMMEVRDMKGIKINGENINNIRYADDTALVTDSESKLQDIVDKIVTENEKLGLSLNQRWIQTVATVAAATVRFPAMQTSLKSSISWDTVVLHWLSKDSSFQSSQKSSFQRV